MYTLLYPNKIENCYLEYVYIEEELYLSLVFYVSVIVVFMTHKVKNIHKYEFIEDIINIYTFKLQILR